MFYIYIFKEIFLFLMDVFALKKSVNPITQFTLKTVLQQQLKTLYKVYI